MTEQQKLEITVGMRVMVKVAAREIPATVVEVGGDWFLVRSDGTGREFKTRRVVDILDRPETDEAGIAEAAAEVAAEEDATAALRREEESEVVTETEKQTEAIEAEKPADADGEGDAKAEADKAEDAKTEEAKSDEDKAENDKAVNDKAEGESAKAEEPPKADDANGEEPAAEGGEAQEATADARPRKNLSLVDAAIEVLRAEKRPMGAKALVRLAVERGLWIPTKAKTPDQSLYGGLYLEMKNSRSPRVKKSAEKGKFELV